MSDCFEGTPDLFSREMGSSTGYRLDCEFCGCVHNQDADEGNPITEGVSVCSTEFAGKQICDCCFGEIEDEILWRMPDILPWFTRRLEAKEKHNAEMRKIISRLIEALKKAE